MKHTNHFRLMGRIVLFLVIMTQQAVSGERMDILLRDGRIIAEDFIAFGTESVRFNTSKLYRIAGYASVITLSSLTDQSMKDMMLQNRSGFNDSWSRIDRYLGDRYVTGFGLAGLYAGGLLFQHKPLREASRQAIQAVVYTGLLTELLKIAVGRTRPYAGDSPWEFDPFSGKDSRKSLPSGHVSVSFALSTVFAEKVNHPLWRLSWYGAAALVGCARMYRNRHWFSDTVTGGILGYSVGTFVLNRRHGSVRVYWEGNRFGLTVPLSHAIQRDCPSTR